MTEAQPRATATVKEVYVHGYSADRYVKVKRAKKVVIEPYYIIRPLKVAGKANYIQIYVDVEFRDDLRMKLYGELENDVKNILLTVFRRFYSRTDQLLDDEEPIAVFVKSELIEYNEHVVIRAVREMRENCEEHRKNICVDALVFADRLKSLLIEMAKSRRIGRLVDTLLFNVVEVTDGTTNLTAIYFDDGTSCNDLREIIQFIDENLPSEQQTQETTQQPQQQPDQSTEHQQSRQQQTDPASAEIFNIVIQGGGVG